MVLERPNRVRHWRVWYGPHHRRPLQSFVSAMQADMEKTTYLKNWRSGRPHI
jgi:hypothetical protein